MIGNWSKVLVLAPHTDDGEFGCGGTMARLVESGATVPPDTLAREVGEATAELGIPGENLTVHAFDVRTFPEHRQEILELLVDLWEDWNPDAVFQPSLHDTRSPGTTSTSYQAYFALEQSHVERKIAALEKYASQQHRRYSDSEYIRNVARTRGIDVNRDCADVFGVYRVVA